ncbi:cell cycle checkpoint protein RAD1 [Venturia canescens]|uniref:cell cycle checkpoint protein RAD1 n=1 Tax=Venturia canescens TaxID=32260 RepID=UPI001C9CB15F|nr:cell cycle checkpoint protein RAD1 [Venturia canescens]
MSQLSNDYVFAAKLGNLKTFVQLLRSVNFKPEATCSASDTGLRVTVEDSKCMQGSCYIPSEVFEEYNLKEDVRFKINLIILVECLGMFWSSVSNQGTSIALQLFYKGTGHPVSILIVEDGAVTDCSLKTQHPDELIDFHLGPESVYNRIVLQTELLRDFLNEVDPTSEVMELHLAPDPPYFRISTHGLGGLCRIELPHDSDLVSYFKCKGPTTFGYKFSHIRPTMKALSCASKVSIRTDEYGLLSFQYMVKSDNGTLCYVEYYISPVIDDD